VLKDCLARKRVKIVSNKLAYMLMFGFVRLSRSIDALTALEYA
jgi:hypothetical protein